VLAESDEATPPPPPQTASSNDDDAATKIPTHKKLCRVAGQANHRRVSTDSHTGNEAIVDSRHRPWQIAGNLSLLAAAQR